jgi:hypothetical protein
MSLKIRIILTVLFCIITIDIQAELNSGLLTLTSPPVSSGNPGEIDFSLLNDSCGREFSPCSVASTDLTFGHDNLKSPTGIIDLGFFDSSFVESIRLIINSDSLKTILDSAFLSHQVIAPAENYVSSYPSLENMGHLFAVNTSEGHYAGIINIGNYIGGIDRYNFYWVYQADASRNLFDQTIVNYKQTACKILSSDSVCITFDSLLEDSRCPTGVICFWEGNAKVRLIFEHRLTVDTLILNTYQGQQSSSDTVLHGYSISLVSVDPYPVQGVNTPVENYSITVNISKTGNSINHNSSVISCFDLKVFPNPFYPAVTISLTNPGNTASLVIYDIAGRIIKSFRNVQPGTIVWNAENMAGGIYILKISDGKNHLSRKLLLAR